MVGKSLQYRSYNTRISRLEYNVTLTIKILYPGDIIWMKLKVWDISLIEWSHKRVCLVRVAQTKTVAKFVSSDLEQVDTCGRRKHTISYLSVYDSLSLSGAHVLHLCRCRSHYVVQSAKNHCTDHVKCLHKFKSMRHNNAERCSLSLQCWR